jgi:proline iminopeptidase
MAQAWPDTELVIIDGAGHGTGPGMTEALVASLDRFAATYGEHGSIGA